jgi:hypothetical protein
MTVDEALRHSASTIGPAAAEHRGILDQFEDGRAMRVLAAEVERLRAVEQRLRLFLDREEHVKDLIDAVISSDHLDDKCEDCAQTYGAAVIVRDFWPTSEGEP